MEDNNLGCRSDLTLQTQVEMHCSWPPFFIFCSLFSFFSFIFCSWPPFFFSSFFAVGPLSFFLLFLQLAPLSFFFCSRSLFLFFFSFFAVGPPALVPLHQIIATRDCERVELGLFISKQWIRFLCPFFAHQTLLSHLFLLLISVALMISD